MSERSLNPEYAPVAERKVLSLIDVIRRHDVGKFDDILVVGCGTGQEAGIIARAFKANTIGIDIGTDFDFDHQGSAPARLVSMDARDLRFPDASFDLIYSFHVLEHIPEPERALREMARALRPGGRYLNGRSEADATQSGCRPCRSSIMTRTAPGHARRTTWARPRGGDRSPAAPAAAPGTPLSVHSEARPEGRPPASP